MSDVLHLPTAVHGLDSAVVDDMIYFAGGATGGWNIQNPLDSFYIYNTTSKIWSTDRLSISRTYLTLSKIGHRLVFAGGATRRLVFGRALASSRIDIFDTLTRTWSTLELNEARFAHAAAVYGDKVFVAGGALETNGNDLVETVDSIEMIDLATNNVSVVFRMNSSRSNMSSGTIRDVVFFASGRHARDVNVPEVFMYNVTSNQWSIVLLPEARTFTSAAVYGNRIFIAGGWLNNLVVSDRIDIFNIDTREWSLMRLEVARGLMVTAVLDTKIYFAGGIGNLFQTLVDVIDAETGEQLSIQLKEPRSMMTAPTDGQRIYFAGGLVNEFTNSDVIEVFDKHGIVDEQEMPRARYNFASVALNQQIFFAGGLLSDRTTTDIVDIYDERTQQWRQERLSQPRSMLASAVLGNLVLFVGGIDNANNTLTTVDIYNTVTGRWSVAQLSQARIAFSLVADNTRLYVAGGWPTFGDPRAPVSDTIDIYDSATNRWSTARLSAARARVSSFAHQSLVFFAGGSNNARGSDEVDIYNSLTDSWSTARLRVGRSLIGIGAVFNRVIFAGGLLEELDRFSTRALDVYDTLTGQWTFSQLTVPRFDLKVLQFENFLLLGAGIGNSVSTVVELYDGNTGVLADTRITIPRHDMLATAMGTKFIFAGGFFMNGGRERLSQSSAIELFETNAVGGVISSFFLSKNIAWRHAVVSGNKIYYSGDDYAKMNIMVLPRIDQPLVNRQQFLGAQTTFNATVLGRGLTYAWTHNNEPLANATQASHTIDRVVQDSEGTYTLTATDMCRNRVMTSAQLEVLGMPVFVSNLPDTVVLCDSNVTLSAAARGADVQYKWFINGQQQFNNQPNITLQAPSGACDADHRVCIHATNTAGTVERCSLLRMASYQRVFDGPTVANERPLWLLKDQVEISVKILEPICTSHAWLENGAVLQSESGTESTLTVIVGPNTDTLVYTVQAYCGAAVVSRPITLSVSYLEWWGVLLICAACVGAAVTSVIVFLKVRTRFRNKQEREVELKELLDDAKRAAINTSNTNESVINVRRWEWIPDDNYSYAPVSDLPFTIDTSNVMFLKKNQQLEIGICLQGDMIFTFKSAKNIKASTTLKEKLLRQSMQVSIYPPRSPKYELTVDPPHFPIGPQDEVRVLVSLTMKMTTKAKINLIIGLEEQELYSAIEFNVASKISPWIDADEVIVHGDPIGMGGYVDLGSEISFFGKFANNILCRFGTVSKATYRGQEVAFKKLRVQDLDPTAKQEFEREIDLMMNLHHPNIIQFIGASRVKGSLAILTEFAPLGSLESSLKRKQLNLQQQLTVLYEAARALQFLHANNILHRDIKPENILVFSLELSAPVHVKLSDFGTARLVSDQPSTMTRGVGTPLYMAPELFGKQGYSRSADIYSFGMLLWSVMHQREPYDSAEFQFPWDVPNFIKAGNRLAISEEICPPDVRALIQQCWQQEPVDRPHINQVAQQLATMINKAAKVT